MGSARAAALDTNKAKAKLRAAGYGGAAWAQSPLSFEILVKNDKNGVGVISQAEFDGYARFERVLKDSLSTKEINFDLCHVYFHKVFTTTRVAEAQAAASFVPSAYTVDDIPKFAEELIAFMDETIAECPHPDPSNVTMRLIKERQRFKKLVDKTF